jgi:hypothetical protein
VRRATYDCMNRGYAKEVLREIEGLRYFDDADIMFYKEETRRGLARLKQKKIVNITEMRRLTIGLVAVEQAIRQRLGGEI